MSSSETFPGDVIASIEEYEAGQNTFDDGDKVRSTVIGRKEIDSKNKIASVTKPKAPVIAQVGDIVIGQVEAVMSSMMAVSIQYINGKPSKAGVECICGTRNIRKRTIALPHDIVTLKIIGHKNGTLHATVSEKDLGVLFTKFTCDVQKLGSGHYMFKGEIVRGSQVIESDSVQIYLEDEIRVLS